MLVGAGTSEGSVKGTCYFSVHAQLIQIIPHAAAIITQMLPGTACHMVGAFVFGLFFFNEEVKAAAFYSAVLSTCVSVVVLQLAIKQKKTLVTLLPCCSQNESKSGASVTDELELRMWELVTGYVT